MNGTPRWVDELSLEPGPPWHSMGTRGVDPGRWLPEEDDDEALVARKRAVLAAHRADVVALRPGAEAAAAEAAAVVAATRGARVGGDAPLEEAALMVPDDLCVLVHRDGAWRLDAGIVCFPSMWRLPDKLGLPIALVHAPVPAYADELADRVDRFLDRLRPDHPVWRRNWFVHDTPELFLPASPPARADVGVPGGLWLRSERQTLCRLAETGAIVFTIRTHQAPLGVLAGRPDVAARMAGAIRTWSPELVGYRGASAWRDDVVRWLESVGG